MNKIIKAAGIVVGLAGLAATAGCSIGDTEAEGHGTVIGKVTPHTSRQPRNRPSVSRPKIPSAQTILGLPGNSA